MPPLKPSEDPIALADLRDRSWSDAQRQISDVMSTMSLAEQIVFVADRYGLPAVGGFMHDAKRDKATFRQAAALLRKVEKFKPLGDLAMVASERKPVVESWRARLNRRARRRMQAMKSACD
jgi:hypothetical protein